MIINEEVKSVIQDSAYLSLVTLCPDGTPHPIIAGKGEIVGDTVVFGIYGMKTTQKNLAENPNAWVLTATRQGGPKGYRLTGTAASEDKQLIFTPVKIDALI